MKPPHALLLALIALITTCAAAWASTVPNPQESLVGARHARGKSWPAAARAVNDSEEDGVNDGQRVNGTSPKGLPPAVELVWAKNTTRSWCTGVRHVRCAWAACIYRRSVALATANSSHLHLYGESEF